MKILQEIWPHEQHDVEWLNGAQHEPDHNIAYIAYGNDASLDWFYTSVVILIEVPPSADRATAMANRNMAVMNVERNFEKPGHRDEAQEWFSSLHPPGPQIVDQSFCAGPPGVTESSARMSWRR